MLSLIKILHNRWVFRRRIHKLSEIISDVIPNGLTILDVGCGDGSLGFLIQRNNPSLSIRGLEAFPRPECLIHCTAFDGVRIPLPDSSVDVCLFVDVLHHVKDIRALLEEACRTSRKYVLVKDHLCEGTSDFAILKLMDWVGNRPHGVESPGNYHAKSEWEDYFESYGLRITLWNESLNLYPLPFDALFGRRLHFIALLEKREFPARRSTESEA